MKRVALQVVVLCSLLSTPSLALVTAGGGGSGNPCPAGFSLQSRTVICPINLNSDVVPGATQWDAGACVNTNSGDTYASSVTATATSWCSATIESIGAGATCQAEAGSTYVSGCESLLNMDFVTSGTVSRTYTNYETGYLGTKQWQSSCYCANDDAMNDEQSLIGQALTACEEQVATGPNTDEAVGYCCVPIPPS